MNPYTELDIPVTASLDEIKQRYRTLAQLHHPDKGGNEEVFKRIKQAYEILSDPIRRKQFDTTGDASVTSIKDEAVSNIIEIVLKIIYRFNVEQDDLIQMAESDIRELLNHVNNDIRSIEATILNLEKASDKLRIKTDNESLLNNIIVNQINLKKTDLMTFQKRVKVCNLMLEILKDYEYGLRTLIYSSTQTDS